MQIRENQTSMQKYNNFETIREKKKPTVTRTKMTNPEHVREIDRSLKGNR